jgi:photosystem II stability/assembly factor-like uncharacterized protein
MRPLLVALVLSPWSALAARGGDLRNFDDAALHAVQFVDENEGWTVGDEGVVWHTVDGGQIWERQPTGVRASLRSVHFLNPYTGWIAGREELPNAAGSVGILLVTRDGGLKWQRVGMNTMPGLNRVRFTDAKTGFALGDGSEQFPAGMFRTANSGRTWEPVPGKHCPGWLSAEFQDGRTGVLAGPGGRVAILRQDSLAPAEVDPLGPRAVNDVKLVGNRAVAVGQGGLILVSWDSAGARWSFADLKLSQESRACLDFHGVHCSGDQVWVVGRPGSVVLHSADKGQSWEIIQTGQPLPLEAVFFVNEKRGWAVGEFGSILGTTDGGRTWRVQQRGGQRAAILFAHARPTALPVDTVALVGGEDGYLASGLRVLSSDLVSLAHASEAQRFALAVRSAGGAAGEMLWQFPLPQHLTPADKSQLLQSWNILHADRAADELLRQLVLALRIWRPSVVVTDSADAQTDGSSADSLVTDAMRAAFAKAADPAVFPEQIKQLGLEPWQASKLYGGWHSHAGAQVALDMTALKPRLQTSARDFASPAVGLLANSVTNLPATRYYHLLDGRTAGAANHRDLMQGVELAPGGVARRKLVQSAELSDELEKALRARRNLEVLAESPAGPLTDSNRILAQVGPTLASMPDEDAALAAFALANQYVHLGQWPLAREIFLLMVDRYSTHPLAVDAYRWLIRHNSSSEARRRHELGQFWMFTQSTVRQAAAPDAKKVAQKLGLPEGSEVPEAVHTQQLGFINSKEDARQWYRSCLDMGLRLAALGPLFATEPSTQFCLQATRRHLGEFDKASDWYTRFVAEHSDGPWRDAAAGELWLMKRSGLPPKPVAYCRNSTSRPFLDGDFKDSCWLDVKPLVLKDAAGQTVKDYPTEARLAYDKDFLYLALSCRHPVDRYVPPVKVRSRDADLHSYDRVSLLLDLDRDYSTYFHFQVDQRGCVCEDCWGDRSWNPRWFVAVHSEPGCWQIEAAIPLTELTGDTVTVGKAWACNIVRILPGRGVQAWSLPADVQPRPEGMGLLIFTEEPSVDVLGSIAKPAKKAP